MWIARRRSVWSAGVMSNPRERGAGLTEHRLALGVSEQLPASAGVAGEGLVPEAWCTNWDTDNGNIFSDTAGAYVHAMP